MNVVCLIVALTALALANAGIVTRKIALAVTGQLLGVVALALAISLLLHS